MSEILGKVQRDLTVSPGTWGRRCEWLWGAASLAGSVASSLFGGSAAKKAAKKAERELAYRSDAEKAWYDKNYNTDYIDTKAGQNLMRRAKEVQDEYVRKADGAAAVGGGTAASVALAKEQANKAMGDTIANIAAQDTARKQQVEDMHHSNLSQLSRERQQVEQNKATATSQAAQNASNALMTAASSFNNGEGVKDYTGGRITEMQQLPGIRPADISGPATAAANKSIQDDEDRLRRAVIGLDV